MPNLAYDPLRDFAPIAAFAKTHGLKVISIADLIAYRQARDKLVRRVADVASV